MTASLLDGRTDGRFIMEEKNAVGKGAEITGFPVAEVVWAAFLLMSLLILFRSLAG